MPGVAGVASAVADGTAMTKSRPCRASASMSRTESEYSLRSATTGAGAEHVRAACASTRSSACTHMGRGLFASAAGMRLRRSSSSSPAHWGGRNSRQSTETAALSPQSVAEATLAVEAAGGVGASPTGRNMPMASWQLTVRPARAQKRRCTPTEWPPRLGSTAGARIHARAGPDASARRAISRRTGFQSQGLALRNWCSDCEAVGESDTAAASRRTDFLPSVVSSASRYACAQRRWSVRGRWPKRSSAKESNDSDASAGALPEPVAAAGDAAGAPAMLLRRALPVRPVPAVRAVVPVVAVRVARPVRTARPVPPVKASAGTPERSRAPDLPVAPTAASGWPEGRGVDRDRAGVRVAGCAVSVVMCSFPPVVIPWIGRRPAKNKERSFFLRAHEVRGCFRHTRNRLGRLSSDARTAVETGVRERPERGAAAAIRGRVRTGPYPPPRTARAPPRKLPGAAPRIPLRRLHRIGPGPVPQPLQDSSRAPLRAPGSHTDQVSANCPRRRAVGRTPPLAWAVGCHRYGAGNRGRSPRRDNGATGPS